jgi:peroxiredoxin
MTRYLAILMLSTFATASSLPALAARVGEPAPDFTGKGSDGKTYHLSDLRGKYVVLEWHNRECPFVKKHYESGNMQRLQKEWTGKGVTWLTVLSSAPGKQGNATAADENAYIKTKKASPSAAILDPEGTIGNLYSAKTTPHMFVIDPKGTLIYNGAIDDKASANKADIQGAKNYVSAALTEAMAGKPVTDASTRPYGCSVKYK